MYQLVVGTISWDWLDHVADTAPLKLCDAVFLDELDCEFSEKQLRTAIHAGTLPAEKHGRTLYVTKRGIREWRERCRVKSLPDSGLSQSAETRVATSLTSRHGSSLTSEKNIELDAALSIMRALRKHSKPT